MPRFYFDTNDGQSWMTDEFGIDLVDREAARDAAVDTLPDIARHALPGGDNRTMAVRVIDEDGHTILTATLSLAVEWV